jgi:hypothetical protein
VGSTALTPAAEVATVTDALFLNYRTIGEDHVVTAPCWHHDRWFVVRLVNGREEVRVSDEFDTLDEARAELRRLRAARTDADRARMPQGPLEGHQDASQPTEG